MIEGLTVSKLNSASLNAGVEDIKLSLLAKRDNIEIMRQTMDADSTVWVEPADDKSVMEFFFIHSGDVEIITDEGPVNLGAGDFFFAEGIEKSVVIKVNEKTELIYVTNAPMFDTVFGFQKDLQKLVEQINEKDNYTLEHCRRVMRYATKLYEQFPGESADFTMDDIVVTALFHDVGKCFLPVELLQKRGKLTMDEARLVYKHPRESARLLKPHFGERIANIAMSHHERLDGSGYPMNLEGDDICFPARIIAVADAFDAMTSERGYNKVMTFQDAAAELSELTCKFDARVTGALNTLIKTGKIIEGKEGGAQ